MAGKRLGNLPPALEFEDAELVAEDDSRVLNGLLGVTFAVSVVFLIFASTLSDVVSAPKLVIAEPLNPGDPVEITFGEPIYMPRHEECIDMENGQDADYAGYGVGCLLYTS